MTVDTEEYKSVLTSGNMFLLNSILSHPPAAFSQSISLPRCTVWTITSRAKLTGLSGSSTTTHRHTQVRIFSFFFVHSIIPGKNVEAEIEAIWNADRPAWAPIMKFRRQPARSPDLNSLDTFFFSILDRAYRMLRRRSFVVAVREYEEREKDREEEEERMEEDENESDSDVSDDDEVGVVIESENEEDEIVDDVLEEDEADDEEEEVVEVDEFKCAHKCEFKFKTDATGATVRLLDIPRALSLFCPGARRQWRRRAVEHGPGQVPRVQSHDSAPRRGSGSGG